MFSFEGFTRFLKRIDKKLENQKIVYIFSLVDRDNDNKVGLEEFMREGEKWREERKEEKTRGKKLGRRRASREMKRVVQRIAR